MLDTFSKIGSALGIPIFIFTVIMPVYQKEKQRRNEKNKQIKKYVVDKINELSSSFYSPNYDENIAINKSLLKIFKKILRLKEVQLYYENPEDKKLIDLCFGLFENGQTGIKGPFSVKCNELGILITLSDKMFEKEKYKKYAIEHIEKLISLGGAKSEN